jgi:hypothetical protein
VPNSGGIDQAIVDLLLADAALAALAPDGVYVDLAPDGATRFVIVGLLDEQDEPVFQARAIEDGLYLVKAVARSGPGSAAAAEAADARIAALLEDAVLVVAGYTPMVFVREGRIRITEPNPNDATIYWLHFGGRYRVMMTI